MFWGRLYLGEEYLAFWYELTFSAVRENVWDFPELPSIVMASGLNDVVMRTWHLLLVVLCVFKFSSNSKLCSIFMGAYITCGQKYFLGIWAFHVILGFFLLERAVRESPLPDKIR